MTKFTQLAPAATISAKALDDNFVEVGPAASQDFRHVRLLRTPAGWQIHIFPDFPTEGAVLATETGGPPVWVTYAELAELLGLNDTPEAMPDPPSGTPAWRQVERCDGQTMSVWGTEWES